MSKPVSRYMINTWEPETPSFWQSTGKATAARNLWISIPALLLAFAVWMVWSVVVVNLPNIGFTYSNNQLFWLTALPGLSGATLRIFYSFMVPIFGGRRWTAISTGSLADSRHRHRPGRAGCEHGLSDHADPGAAVRLRRRQFRLVDGQHQLFLSEGEQGFRAGHECGPGQPGRVGGAVRRAAGDHRLPSSAPGAAIRSPGSRMA